MKSIARLATAAALLSAVAFASTNAASAADSAWGAKGPTPFFFFQGTKGAWTYVGFSSGGSPVSNNRSQVGDSPTQVRVGIRCLFQARTWGSWATIPANSWRYSSSCSSHNSVQEGSVGLTGF